MLYIYGTNSLPGNTDMRNDLLGCYSPLSTVFHCIHVALCLG